MSDFTDVRIGQDGLTGDVTALFLKVFSGEVLTRFNEVNIMRALHMVRPLNNAKSAQFPATYQVTAALHTPGTAITGQLVEHTERVISIDGFLVADVFLNELDELMNHFEVRGMYTTQIGEKLANTWDQQVLSCIVNGARASALFTGGDAGTTITDAGLANQGNVIASGVFDMAQAAAEHNLPSENRNVVFPPAQYYLVAQTTNVINRDWDGQGSYSRGTVPMIGGVMLWMSNNIVASNVTTGPAAYQGNFSTTVGVGFHSSAAGSVVLRDITSVLVPKPENLGNLLYGKLAVGSDYLRPEACFEFKTS